MHEMSISAWLRNATKVLKTADISSARLDAELILAHTLRKPRTYLHTHLEDTIDDRQRDIANARLDLRQDRTPLAYIIGHKEFYGRRFRVTPDTLVPRPESEDIISLLLDITADEIAPKTLVDVGCGSGILGISAKLERPNLDVTLLDISRKALLVAQKNATALNADVTTLRSNLLSLWTQSVDYIVANLPYVDESWQTSPELRYEPALALYAKDNGLALISRLIEQAAQHLTTGGYLLLEADPVQHEEIIRQAVTHGFSRMKTVGYAVLLQRTR